MLKRTAYRVMPLEILPGERVNRVYRERADLIFQASIVLLRFFLRHSFITWWVIESVRMPRPRAAWLAVFAGWALVLVVLHGRAS
jgi:hypothetical protein